MIQGGRNYGVPTPVSATNMLLFWLDSPFVTSSTDELRSHVPAGKASGLYLIMGQVRCEPRLSDITTSVRSTVWVSTKYVQQLNTGKLKRVDMQRSGPHCNMEMHDSKPPHPERPTAARLVLGEPKARKSKGTPYLSNDPASQHGCGVVGARGRFALLRHGPVIVIRQTWKPLISC